MASHVIHIRVIKLSLEVFPFLIGIFSLEFLEFVMQFPPWPGRRVVIALIVSVMQRIDFKLKVVVKTGHVIAREPDILQHCQAREFLCFVIGTFGEPHNLLRFEVHFHEFLRAKRVEAVNAESEEGSEILNFHGEVGLVVDGLLLEDFAVGGVESGVDAVIVVSGEVVAFGVKGQVGDSSLDDLVWFEFSFGDGYHFFAFGAEAAFGFGVEGSV